MDLSDPAEAADLASGYSALLREYGDATAGSSGGMRPLSELISALQDFAAAWAGSHPRPPASLRESPPSRPESPSSPSRRRHRRGRSHSGSSEGGSPPPYSVASSCCSPAGSAATAAPPGAAGAALSRGRSDASAAEEEENEHRRARLREWVARRAALRPPPEGSDPSTGLGMSLSSSGERSPDRWSPLHAPASSFPTAGYPIGGVGGDGGCLPHGEFALSGAGAWGWRATSGPDPALHADGSGGSGWWPQLGGAAGEDGARSDAEVARPMPFLAVHEELPAWMAGCCGGSGDDGDDSDDPAGRLLACPGGKE